MTDQPSHDQPQHDRPWLMRTYSGHSSAAASNALYRTNLTKGQTGLSIAFDLPTQTGYDPDDSFAQSEVGKVGVPVTHLGHMAELLEGIPQDQMNTSMTINATAAWLLGLYVAHAQNKRIDLQALRGTTQNDIVKEYLSRGTYIFAPEPSRRLTVDVISYCAKHMPRWNPINVCSYHLQEAGATTTQEIAYALATAIDVLDAVRNSGQVPPDRFDNVVGSISFFVNSGIRFVEEVCKVRAFTQMWDSICAQRYGVIDPQLRRFRYGVQVNSLGLTEAQPENNVTRIALEMLGVTLSKGARTRSLQLPAWNEALGLPRPWDQQWSLRMQQILAEESDLLEYEDIFDGSKVIEARTDELISSAQTELDEVLALGGAFAAIKELKTRLVASHTARVRRIEQGQQTVVGVNKYTETADSPLVNTAAGPNTASTDAIMRVNPSVVAAALEDLERWRAQRDSNAVVAALDDLRIAAKGDVNIMGPTIAAAHAGVTTGEWANALREEFGDYRAPTGIGGAAKATGNTSALDGLSEVAERCSKLPGGPPRLLIAKPGLDGHSNGAEQIAVAARDAGMEVIYDGIRVTPQHIATVARDEDVDIVALSILSGGHMELVPEVQAELAAQGIKAAVVVGGIIPANDQASLLKSGVVAIYTPKDFDLSVIMSELAELTAKLRSTN